MPFARLQKEQQAQHSQSLNLSLSLSPLAGGSHFSFSAGTQSLLNGTDLGSLANPVAVVMAATSSPKPSEAFGMLMGSPTDTLGLLQGGFGLGFCF